MKTRKELKDEYKQRSPPMGVFQIRNLTNGKIFVQRASDLSKIWESQKFKLENRGHTNEALQADWNTFGPDCFIFESFTNCHLQPTRHKTTAPSLSRSRKCALRNCSRMATRDIYGKADKRLSV